jgi:hypothetical protein
MTSYRRTQLPTTAPGLVRTGPTAAAAPHVRLLVAGTGDGISRRRAPSR